MFKIGEFSRISRVPAKTLRYYDEIGLFSPITIDQFTGYRYYSADQIPRLNHILALKAMGLSLAEIGSLLDEELSPEELRGIFRLKKVTLQQEIEEATTRLQQVSKRLSLIEKEGQMPQYEVIIKKIAIHRVMSIRQIAPHPEDIGNLLGEAAMALHTADIMPVGQPYTIFYDAELQDTNMDIETVIPVDDTVETQIELVGGRKLIAHNMEELSKVAAVVHKGGYDDFEAPYAALGQWIEENDYNIIGPSREVYLHPPSETEEPITEIQYPIGKA